VGAVKKIQPGEVTYPLPSVLKALRIAEDDVTNWQRRGYDGIDVAPSGRGRARRVTSAAVIRFAVIKSLTDAGLTPLQASLWAESALTQIAVTKKHLPFTIRVYPDGEVTGFIDDERYQSEKPRQGAEIEIAVNLRAIIARVRAALEAMGAD
jgi:hypothetical protein